MTTDDGNPIGVGFNVDVDRFGCAISVDDSVRMVSGADGTTIPFELAVTSDGVLVGDEATDPPEDAPVVRPLPQFGTEGVDDEFVKTAAPAELPLVQFFREGLPDWRRNTEAVLRDDLTPAVEEAFEIPVVGIPGGYTDVDAAQIRRTAMNAGVRITEFVPAPLGSAAAHAPALASSGSGEASVNGPLAVVHIDEYWCNVAFVTVESDPLTLTVHARTAVPDDGRAAFVREISEWLLDRFAAEHDVDVFVTPEGESAVRDAVERGIDRSDGRSIEVSLEDADGISIGGSPVSLHRTIDASDGYAPLNDAIERIVERLEALRRDGEFDRDAFETVLLTGSGAHVPTVRRAIRSYFGTEPQDPARGTIDTAAAIGVALLAGATQSERQIEDVFGENIGVEVLDGADLERETIAPHTRPRRDGATVELGPVHANQVQGQVPLVVRHPVTDAEIKRNVVHVTGLPGDDATTVEVTVHPDCDAYRVSARLGDAGADDDLVKARLVPDTLPEVAPLRAPGVGVDESAADEVFDDRDDGSSTSRIDVYENVSTDRVVKESVEIRNSLWRATETSDAIEPEDIDALRRRIDNALDRAGVSLIKPDFGAEAVGGRHEVKAIREADQPRGTIVEVLAPGYEIDGRVQQEAQVVVSDGTGATAREPDSSDDAESEDHGVERTDGELSADADDWDAAPDADRPDDEAADGERSRVPDSGTTPVTEPPEDADVE